MMRHVTILALLFVCGGLSAQRGHHLGSIVLDVNTGIEAYHTTNRYTQLTTEGFRDTTVDAEAGNAHGSVGLEIGIGKFVGVGVRAKTSTFFRSLDAVMNARGDVSANDLLLMINLHPLPFKRFDLVLGSELGISKLRMDVNDIYQTMIIYVSPRFYLKRLGFNLRAALPVFNYDDLAQSQVTGQYLLSKWKASGLGVSLGVQYRFW
jgi:hypothetical protein